MLLYTCSADNYKFYQASQTNHAGNTLLIIRTHKDIIVYPFFFRTERVKIIHSSGTSLYMELSFNYFQIVIISRVLSFLLVFFFNALMWTLFVKSLRGSSSSATATVINTGSNFICTVSTAILCYLDNHY